MITEASRFASLPSHRKSTNGSKVCRRATGKPTSWRFTRLRRERSTESSRWPRTPLPAPVSLQEPHFQKGGVPCSPATSKIRRFFREDEQATAGIPVRGPGQTRAADRPRRQGTGREARPQRSLPLRFRQASQAVLLEIRPVLTARSGTTTFREDRPSPLCERGGLFHVILRLLAERSQCLGCT